MLDHDSLKITQFNGLFDRGEDEVVPVDHFLSCQNLAFTSRGFKTRDGSSLSLTHSNIRRICIYRRTGEAQRLLVLDSTGKLYDSTNFGAIILNIASMTDFSCETLFNRAYITPHDGVTGLAGDKVYVYEGSPTDGARPAAGVAPTGFTLTLADSATSGKVEVGVHAIGVSYITTSGFITKPGGFQSYTALGDRKLDVSAIPVGPSYVAARILIGTKIITDFNGDFQSQTYFFIPNGTIVGNVTTTATVDFYDSELLDDASYLLDQLETIPAGTCIANYKGRMCVGGENLNQSTVRVSKAGEPEQFDSTEGFFNANPGDAGSGVKALLVHRDSIIAFKSQRSYIATGTDDSAVFWHVDELDMSVGTEPHGVGRILDFGQTLEDVAFIVDRKGLILFTGTFAGDPLSYAIDDYWARINKAAFSTVEICIDPINYLIYVAIPLDAATAPSHVLVGDYNNGLSAKTIKWCPWVFPVAPQSIVVDIVTATKAPVFKFAGYAGNVYQIDSSVTLDSGSTIDHWLETCFLPHETSKGTREGVYHFAGIVARMRGTGNLEITLRSQDSVKTLTAVEYALASAPGIDIVRKFNFVAQKCAIKLRHPDASSQMICSKLSVLTAWLWSEEAH